MRGLMGGLKGGLPNMREVAGIALGIVAISAATKALSKGTPLFDGSGPSSLVGEPWNAKQYAAAIGITAIGGKLVNRFLPGAGHALGIAGTVFIVAKTLMPLVGKSEMLQKYLGAGEEEGAIKVDDGGQSWIYQGGRWNALQGLVEATPMDGYYDNINGYDDEDSGMAGLVEATPMDGYEDDYGVTTSSLSVNS